MPNQLKGRKVAFLATDGVEQVEPDALVLPGGVASPDTLRTNDDTDERRLDEMVEQSFPASDPLPGPISIG